MQIRERSGRTEYLRSWYDKEAKRSRQKLITSDEFTPEERAEADAYHAQKHAQSKDLTDRWMAETAHEQIERIAGGIEAGAIPRDTDALWAALARFRRAMRKAGITQPARKKTKKGAPEESQGD